MKKLFLAILTLIAITSASMAFACSQTVSKDSNKNIIHIIHPCEAVTQYGENINNIEKIISFGTERTNENFIIITNNERKHVNLTQAGNDTERRQVELILACIYGGSRQDRFAQSSLSNEVFENMRLEKTIKKIERKTGKPFVNVARHDRLLQKLNIIFTNDHYDEPVKGSRCQRKHTASLITSNKTIKYHYYCNK